MDEEKPSRVSETSAIFLRSSALFFDSLQALLNLFVVGIFLNRLLTPIIFLFYLTWFRLLGISFIKIAPGGSKQLSSSITRFILAFGAKMIPVVDFTIGIAAWSLSVHLTVKNTQDEDAGKKPAAKPLIKKEGQRKIALPSTRSGSGKDERLRQAKAEPSVPMIELAETKPAEGENTIGEEVKHALGRAPATQKTGEKNQKILQEIRGQNRGREGRDVEREAEKEVDREFGYASSANVFDPYKESSANPDGPAPENTDFVGLPSEERPIMREEENIAA